MGNSRNQAPPPPALMEEPRNAPQLEESDEDEDAIKEELGPGSWPRPGATMEQMTEAGQLERHTAEMKRRSMAAKKKPKAIQEETRRERAMEAKEQ
ncbi:hypothetical protein B9Z55_028766 [Caenorhabditis nigoni]|uniref:Uncharacterized protein n=1 Tax=Caenorhabditis nigoni TaxID=1611254 RepID=A0A2G5SAJ6_9PELO|nr:hypothetical protein B9Z55_028766 [Caenorhabditis nigoni]